MSPRIVFGRHVDARRPVDHHVDPLLPVSARPHVKVAIQHRQVRAPILRDALEHVEGVRMLSRAHHPRTLPDDPRLLGRDLREVTPQDAAVIEGHLGDHAHVRGRDAGRVETPAQPHLEHGDVGARVPKGLEGQERRDLEEAQLRKAGLGRRVEELGDPRLERVVSQGHAIDPDPLPEAMHVRRGEQARAIPRRPRHRLDHHRGAALAVGAGDLHHQPHLALRVAPQPRGLHHPIEIELHAAIPEAVEPANGVLVRRGHFEALLQSQRWWRISARVSRISERGAMTSTMPCSSRNSAR